MEKNTQLQKNLKKELEKIIQPTPHLEKKKPYQNQTAPSISRGQDIKSLNHLSSIACLAFPFPCRHDQLTFKSNDLHIYLKHRCRRDCAQMYKFSIEEIRGERKNSKRTGVSIGLSFLGMSEMICKSFFDNIVRDSQSVKQLLHKPECLNSIPIASSFLKSGEEELGRLLTALEHRLLFQKTWA